MAAPVDASRVVTNITVAATSHNINVGSPNAGDLLIVALIARTAGATVTFTGYTRISTGVDFANGGIWWRLADGTEGATDPLSTAASTKLVAICWRIVGATSSPPPEAATAIETSSLANTANGPNLAPTGGSKDYLWITAGNYGGSGDATAAPTNYTNLSTGNTGGGGAATTNAVLFGASRQLTAASEDPGPFTHPALTSNQGDTFTVAVYPSLAKSLVTAGMARPQQARQQTRWY